MSGQFSGATGTAAGAVPIMRGGIASGGSDALRPTDC